MLSVLIPVYNFDVQDLVKALLTQCREAEVEFEIICIDDNSEDSFRKKNEELKALPNVTWIENERNTGRSAIRNQLAEKARYPYLLYLDCDSRVDRGDFIRCYLDQLPTENVLVGGRKYDQHPPSLSCYLHWLYGTKREQRLKAGFQSNNFLIPKDYLDKIRFDEKIIQYGHEDTIFGQELQTRGISVMRIKNPIIHIGLEYSHTFLRKQEVAIDNLISLEKAKPIRTKLQRTVDILRKIRMTYPLLWLFRSRKNRLKRKLLGPRPSLLLLDLYKIGYYLDASAQK